MITFLINLSTEKISESTMKIYLYPYLKENKLRIIEGYGLEYNDIVNDIKYYIYNSDNIKSERKYKDLLDKALTMKRLDFSITVLAYLEINIAHDKMR